LISPDGHSVAASQQGQSGAALALYATGSRRAHRFFDLAQTTAAAVAWSPDSRYVAAVLASRDPLSARGSGLAVIDVTRMSYRMIARGPIYGASFAPGGADRIVFGWARSMAPRAQVDLYLAAVSGAGPSRLTHGGRSLNPVWGAQGIAYDRERLRAHAEPAFSLWLIAPAGAAPHQLASGRVPALREGLVPLAFSHSGTDLLAAYEGLDTAQAWTVRLPGGAAQALRVDGSTVSATALSEDGSRVLAERPGFPSTPSAGTVESVPFDGGQSRTLIAHGSQASWNL